MSWTWKPPERKTIPTVEQAGEWLVQKTPFQRLLLLSDIHANWAALVAVLESARGQHDAAWFLGDIVGYGPRPVECTCFLQQYLSKGDRWQAGNHDLGMQAVARKKAMVDHPDANLEYKDLPVIQGVYRDSADATTSRTVHYEMLERESPQALRWLLENATEARSQASTFDHEAGRLVCVHASLLDHVRTYLLPYEQKELSSEFLRLASHRNPTWQVYGHTHLPLLAVQRENTAPQLLPIHYGRAIPIDQGAYLINPGSVGLPRDGDPRASYAILNVEQRTITFQRVEYDILTVQEEMLARLQTQGVSNKLIERLKTARSGDTELYESVYNRLPDGGGLIPRS